MGSYPDWNFANVNWSLSDPIYHTAPPSMTTSAYCAKLVKHATTGALSDGRIIFWARSPAVDVLFNILFRNQAADGGADTEDSYLLQIRSIRIQLFTFIGGTPAAVDDHLHTYTWIVDTWIKLRVTWWSAAGKLLLRVERWTGTAWVTLGGAADDDLEDPNDRWADAAVNRCGFLNAAGRFVDDVEVWG